MKLDLNKVYEWTGPCSFCKGTGIDSLKKAFRTKWDRDISCWHCNGTGDACSEEQQRRNHLEKIAKSRGVPIEQLEKEMDEMAKKYRKQVPENACDTCEGQKNIITGHHFENRKTIVCPDCGGTGVKK